MRINVSNQRTYSSIFQDFEIFMKHLVRTVDMSYHKDFVIGAKVLNKCLGQFRLSERNLYGITKGVNTLS